MKPKKSPVTLRKTQKKSSSQKRNPKKSPNFLNIKNNKSKNHQENARYFMHLTLFIPPASVIKLVREIVLRKIKNGRARFSSTPKVLAKILRAKKVHQKISNQKKKAQAKNFNSKKGLRTSPSLIYPSTPPPPSLGVCRAPIISNVLSSLTKR